MVQYRDPAIRTGLNSNYWKLPIQTPGAEAKRMLEDGGVAFNENSPAARRALIYSRFQRGLLCYEKCSTSELRAFCKARKLALLRGEKSSRIDLAHALYEVDKSQTFDLFMDLPPEMRVEIYKHHLRSLDTQRQILAQPPLLKVSRLVRKECLPLFYSICDFTIEFGERLYAHRVPVNNKFIRATGLLTYPQGLQGPTQPLGHLLTRLCVVANVRFYSPGSKRTHMRYEVCFEACKDGVELAVRKAHLDRHGSPEAEAELRRRAKLLLETFRGRDERDRVADVVECKDQAKGGKQWSKLMLESTDLSGLQALSFIL